MIQAFLTYSERPQMHEQTLHKVLEVRHRVATSPRDHFVLDVRIRLYIRCTDTYQFIKQSRPHVERSASVARTEYSAFDDMMLLMKKHLYDILLETPSSRRELITNPIKVILYACL